MLGAENCFKEDDSCDKCDKRETFNHIFFECPSHETHRHSLLKLHIPVIDRYHLLFPDPEISEKVREAVFDYLSKINYLNKI